MVTKKLKDLANVYISSVDKKAFEHELPVKLCNFTDVYYNWQLDNFDSFSFMKATATPDEISQYSLKANDVCITKDSETRDDIGMSCFIEQDLSNAILGYHCALIRPNSKLLDGGYLNCFLKTNTAKKYFSFRASGSGQRYTLSLENIENIEIPYVDLENQRTISRLFRNINEKIKLNNRINDNLLQILETEFDYSFSQTNGFYHGSTNIKDICEIVWGQCPDGKNILDLNTSEPNSEKYCSGAGDMQSIFLVDCQAKTNSSRRTAFPGDILLSVAGSIGRFCYCDEKISLGRAAVAFRPKYWNERFFVYMLVKKYSQVLIKQAIGSVQKVISDGNLSVINFIYNKQQIANRKDLNDIIDKLVNINHQTNQLKKVRDYLFPLLLNGQITIR